MGILYIYILSEHLFLKISYAYKFKRLMKENEKNYGCPSILEVVYLNFIKIKIILTHLPLCCILCEFCHNSMLF